MIQVLVIAELKFMNCVQSVAITIQRNQYFVTSADSLSNKKLIKIIQLNVY